MCSPGYGYRIASADFAQLETAARSSRDGAASPLPCSSTAYIERARNAQGVEILTGGKTEGDEGWFVRPTLIRTENPLYETMCEEVFGPSVPRGYLLCLDAGANKRL